MTDYIKTVICRGSEGGCENCCQGVEPPDPPEPGCDVTCLVTNYFSEPTNWRHYINPGFPGLGYVDFVRNRTPETEICDQDIITGTIVIQNRVFSTESPIEFEIFEAVDASVPIYTLISKTHSNGDSIWLYPGFDASVVFQWRYEASGVTVDDIIDPFENCCIRPPEIGIIFRTDQEFHLVNGPGWAYWTLCGVYVE